jgi:transcriptional regulator with XRE-family HTH domain
VSPRRRKPGPLAAAFGRIVKSVRESKRLTLEELASAADMLAERVSILESGADEPILEELFRLSTALDMRPSELLNRTIADATRP